MSANPTPRYNRLNPGEPVTHDLPPFLFGNESIGLRLEVRRSEDATWRGRLLFGVRENEDMLATAEIFCGTTEPDLWEAVRDLRDHHVRDLYRSLIDE